jgi:hypothetical protein
MTVMGDIPASPIHLSVHDDLFDEIIHNLNDPDANTLHTELRQLLQLREDHNHHNQIIRLIGRLQHIIHHHPRTSSVNFQLLYPVPRFDYAIQTQGPGYATGMCNHD